MKRIIKIMVVTLVSILLINNIQPSYAASYPVPQRSIYYKTPVMTGDDVKYVQSGLKTLGYSISVDGKFGPGSKSVTQKFQKDNGLSVDGSFGPLTLKKLQEKLGLNSMSYIQANVVGDIKKSNSYRTYSNFFRRANFTSSKNFIIPGLNTSMVPQGMCDAGNYILISAYDKNKKHNSCIYVINKSTGKLSKSVYLDSKSHVGGLAYDGKYVWVANGTESTVSKVALTNIIGAKDGGSVRTKKYTTKTVGGYNVRASFITYSNGLLWIGQFDEDKSTYAYGYPVSRSDETGFRLIASHRIKTLSRMQGMAFDKSGRLILSQSYGRNNSSKIYVCDKPVYTSKNNVKYDESLKINTSITAPPASQNMFVGNDNLLYVLFESAADFYRNGRDGKGKANTPIDRVCPLMI